MSGYMELKHFWDKLGIEEGDIVFISSDVKRLLATARMHREPLDLNILIDALIRLVGKEGTVIFPTYNWDFCSGKTFDIKKTRCKTGSLGTVALKRDDFRRTQHPIYSFAVWGKYQKELCEMDNKDSFGNDSPFAFFKKHNVKNYIIDVTLQHCFTYVHFVEEQSGVVKYRYIKEFTADYIDENGQTERRAYSMFVRDLDLDVFVTINPLEDDLIKEGAEFKYIVNDINVSLIRMGDAYDIIMKDIVENSSKKLCTYIGQ